jgi:hypothetical protein
MPLPRELTVEQCKLLQNDALVERYQRLRKVLETIARSDSLGVFAKRTAFAAACETLDELAVRMSRDRYRIGFLGLSQAGKSTSVGCVVGAIEDEDNPAPPGGNARAATAVATRIRPVRLPHQDCPQNQRHHIELFFLTATQFIDRLRDIFAVLGLPFDDAKNPGVWLDQLSAHEKENPLEDVDDRNTAIRLIHAKQKFSDRVIATGAEPVARQGSFDLKARTEYVIHPLDEPLSKVSEYALLREMRVWYCTTVADFSDRLDLIDLPGLGVERKSDETLTTAFLGELDGAFLFSMRHQLTGDEAATLTKHLRKHFGDTLSGRMWLVTTYMHQLKPTQLEDRTGTFKTLADQIIKHGFVNNNVVFVSTNVFKAYQSQPEGARKSGDAWDAVKSPETFKPAYDDKDNLVYPPAIEAFPAFKEAYAGLAFDGGISRIRHLMTQNVEAEVRKQTQDHAIRVMNSAMHALSKDLAASREMGGMRHEQRVDAAKAASLIEVIAEDLERPNDRVDGMAEHIIDTLGVLLEQFFGDRTSSPARPECTSFANALKAQGVVKAMDIIPEAVGGVSDDIDAIAKECSAMSVEAVKHAMEKWQDACVKLKDGLSPDGERFLEHCLQEFQMPSHLADEMWSNGRGPSVSDYRDLMRKKIALVSHEFVSRLAKELAAAVKMFSGRMRSVGDESAVANPVQIESIKAIERELQQLQAI